MRFIILMLLVCTGSVQAHSFDLESGSAYTSESADGQWSIESESEQTGCDANCADIGEWRFGLAFGAGYLSSPIADEDDTWLPVIPRFSYYGEKFFVDNFTVGYNFAESESYSFDIIAEPGLDFLHFDTASDLQKAFITVSITPMNGNPEDAVDETINIGDYRLEERKFSYLAGPSFRFRWDDFSLYTSYKSEVFGESGGREAKLELNYQLLGEAWGFQTAVGAVWKSKELVDYYYGIAESETPEFFEHLAYSASDSALNSYIKFESQYKYSDNYTLIVSLKQEKLDNSIVTSPIVDTDKVYSAFIGIGYEFD